MLKCSVTNIFKQTHSNKHIKIQYTGWFMVNGNVFVHQINLNIQQVPVMPLPLIFRLFIASMFLLSIYLFKQYYLPKPQSATNTTTTTLNKNTLIIDTTIDMTQIINSNDLNLNKTDIGNSKRMATTTSARSAISKTATDIIQKTLINANLTFKLGLFWDNRSQYHRALYFYKLYLRKPNHKQGELQQFSNALIAFELLGNQQMNERNLEFLRAHCFHNENEYKLALEYYNKFLENHRSKQPDIMAAYNNMALLYYELGEYNKALEYFNKIGFANIVAKNYGFRVAHSLQNTSTTAEFNNAIKYYDLYLNNPNTTIENKQNTNHNLGVLYYDNNKNEEAIEMFNKLGTDEIKERNLEFKMAHLCAKLGEKEGAIKYLNACKNKPKIYGEYAIICQGIMAQILYEIGEYNQVINEFELLGKEQIIEQDLYFPAAFSYFKCGFYDKSLKMYDNSLYVIEILFKNIVQ